jgi:hypothetical protein
MKSIINTILAVAAFTAVTGSLSAEVSVDGYYRRDGNYVEPHYRSNPNNTATDNWSTRGNVNPHTGEYGTRRQDDGLHHYRQTNRNHGNW